MSYITARRWVQDGKRRVEPVGNIRTVRALIDTGADTTAIHPAALADLGSRIIEYTPMRRPGSHVENVALHDFYVAIGAGEARSAWILTAVAAVKPATPSVLAIIGRDVLQLGTLLYEGPAGRFTLSF